MTVIQINAGNFGSTGGIAKGINSVARREGMQAYMAYPRRSDNKKKEQFDILIGTRVERKICCKLGKFTGSNEWLSWLATLFFLLKVKKINPDCIHFHNLHDNYINLSMLFHYVKRRNIKVIWTLHDCWAFTGRCPYFTLSGCDRWKTGCGECRYPSGQYPPAYIDTTRKQWKFKKRWFEGVKQLTVVTPSEWLADLAKDSYLREYPIKVINNGINLAVFKPTPGDFRKKIMGNGYLLLGVSFGWSYRKGFDVFVELAKRLPGEYRIVLVGTDAETDKQLPENIISIHRTHNQKELAEIYSAADLFVNPTREENYPTVNMEALACGTPVITFKTGGSPEIIDETCGSAVECDDVDALEKEIIYRCEVSPFNREACLNRAESFDMCKRFEEYIKLYEDVVSEKR